MPGRAAQGMRRELVRAASGGGDFASLGRAVGAVLARAVPHDLLCWGSVDPDTLLATGQLDHARPAAYVARAYAHEELVPDVNQFRDLARAARPVGLLSAATGGEPARSARYRDLLAPLGMRHELRAALVVDGACWGFLQLARRADRPDFSPAEVRLIASVAAHLAEAQRLSVLGTPPAAAPPAAPEVVLLDAANQVEGVGAAAEGWLAELGGVGPGDRPLPDVVASVAAAARSAGARPARARVRLPSGPWLVVHGVPLAGPEGRVAVLVEPAQAADVSPLIAQAYGFSARERDVLVRVLRGLETERIASELCLSPYTVQDHLKSIFAKTGVRSRRELAGEIFFNQYWPRQQAGERPDARGHLR